MPTDSRPYGGYDLKLGDNDPSRRFGGAIRSARAGENVPHPSTIGFVTQLQQDLQMLWFLEPNDVQAGNFDETLQWAVREFQIAASTPGRGAAELIDGTYNGKISASQLRRHALVDAEVYPSGSGITGTVNQPTAIAIAAWKVANLRRPIVFQTYGVQTTTAQATSKVSPAFTLVEEGFWRADRPLQPSQNSKHRLRVFACDFTGDLDALPASDSGTTPPQPPRGGRFVPIGRLNHFGIPSRTIVGPYSSSPHTLIANARSLAGVSPSSLTGKGWQDLTPAEQTTYRVIRSIAQAECGGLFDSLNAYDTKWISAGLYQLGAFTALKSPDGHVTKGELGAFLAYLRNQSPEMFNQLLQTRGVSVVENWVEASVFNSDQRKYEAHISLQSDGGTFSSVTVASDAQFFRNWPFFYRLEMAFRTVGQMRSLWWPYARQRLADVLSTPWGPNAPGGGAGVKIGDVFSSETTVAALLRWHVLLPAHIVSGGKAGAKVKDAFSVSGLDASKPLTSYSTGEEVALFNGILGQAEQYGNADLKNYLRGIKPANASNSNSLTPADLSDPGMKPLPLNVDRPFKFFADGIPFPRPVPV